MGSFAGHGYTQISVVALDRTSAALELWSLGLVTAQNRVDVRATIGAVGYPGAGSDWWLNPQVLARQRDRQVGELRVLRMPYVLGDRTFRAIRFQVSGESSFMAWNFDEPTGVLLRNVTSSLGAAIQGPIAQGDSREGQTLITHNTIRDLRVLNIPWAASPTPSWVRQVRSIRYEGQVTIHAPGANPLVGPMAVVLEREAGGSDWVRFQQTTTTSLETSRLPRVFGGAQLAGLWIPPSAMGRLRSGQLLDRDPVTGVVTSVGPIGRILTGVEALGIIMEGSGFRSESFYDRRTGILTYVRFAAPLRYMRYEGKLVSVK